MRENGSVLPAATITSTQVINGVATMGLHYASDGSTAYFSNGSSGLRLHRIFDPQAVVEGCGTIAETVTFTPPVTVLPGNGTLGQSTNSGGSASVDLGPCGVFGVSYSSTSTLQAFERVSVPAGQFDALKVLLTLIVAGPGGSVSQTSTGWFAAGIGEVRSVEADGALSELVSTNIVRTAPDPIALAAQSNVPVNSAAVSNRVTITGITAAAPLSIAGGEYSINGGAFTTQSGSVTNGQNIQVRVASSALPLTTTVANLTVGGVAATFSVTTAAGAPTAPTAVSASANVGSIIVSFSAPASNGGAAITGYTAACSSSNGGVPGSNSGGAGVTSIRVTGLTNGKSYTCTVTAINAIGAGNASAPSALVMPFDITPILDVLLLD